MSDEPLFDMAPSVLPESLSADRRRTLRQRARVAAGIHPLAGGKAHPEWGSCGDCRFRELFSYHNRTYPKCTNPIVGRLTHGAGSDVRAWWPACGEYDMGDPKVGPDAMRCKP